MLDLQMKFLEQKPRKICSNHSRESQFFCYKLNCNRYPYLCSGCAKENVHGHTDNITGFFEAAKQLCADITRKCSNPDISPSRLMVNGAHENDSGADHAAAFATLDKIEREIAVAIREVREAIKMQLSSPAQLEKRPLATTMRFYRNPNILLKKIASEATVEFVDTLKTFLRSGRQVEQANAQSAAAKLQLDLLKSRINSIIDNSAISIGSTPPTPVANGAHYIKTARMSSATEQPLPQTITQLRLVPKKVYGLPVVPQHIYNFKDSMLVCGAKLSYVFNLEQKSALPVEYGFSLAAQVSDPQSKASRSFIAISPPNLLVYYCDGVKSQLSLKYEPTALAAIVSGEVLALLGNAEGEIEAIRIQTGQSIIKLKKHKEPINCIRAIQNQSAFLASSKEGLISVYQCQLRPALTISFINYSIATMEALNGFDIFRTDLVMYSETGGLKIFDIRTNVFIAESKQRDNAIAELMIVGTAKSFVCLTLGRGDKQLKAWYLNRERNTLTQERIPCGIRHTNLTYNSAFVWNGTLWQIKDDSAEVHVSDLALTE